MKITTLHLKLVTMFILAAITFQVWYKYSHNYFYLPAYTYSTAGQERQLKMYLETAPSSNDLIVRSVYFDNRARNGHDDEIGVFLVAVKEFIIDLKLIVGCGVGKEISSNFIVRSLEENRLMREWVYVKKRLPHFLYEEYILECYNIPMMNGSKAFVLLKYSSNSSIHIATSEYPLMFPAPEVQPTGKYDFSIVTCTEAHNKKVAWLREFIRYQKTTGIDRVHINILDTYIKDGGLADLLEDPQVAKNVAEGYVTMTVWKDILESSKKIYSFSAILRKLDCIYRFRGTYDYAFLLDSDDFFNPVVPGKSYLKDYVQDWCRYRSIGSCYFSWYYYYPEACGLRNEKADDGNITRLLKSYKSWYNNHFKSVHLISAVVDTGFHHALCKDCLLPGYHAVYIPPNIAYVAHLRKYAQPPDGC